MADISDAILLDWMIKDPSWCLLYHREQVKQLLPVLAKSHILVTKIETDIKQRQKKLEDIVERKRLG